VLRARGRLWTGKVLDGSGVKQEPPARVCHETAEGERYPTGGTAAGSDGPQPMGLARVTSSQGSGTSWELARPQGRAGERTRGTLEGIGFKGA
jgi:hypothetical protein